MTQLMNPEIKAEWLEDLRSDKYAQGTGTLRSSDGKQCCLDILNAIAVRNGVIGEPQLVLGDYDYIHEYRWTDEKGIDQEQDSLLPEPVRVWAGLGDLDPEVTYDVEDEEGIKTKELLRLSEINDDYGADFLKIADAIEESL